MENMTKLGIDLEEMRNFKFKRIDLTDPNSILNYGNDVIEIMSSIVSSLRKIMREEDTSTVNFIEDIASINAFDNELEQLKTKNNKGQNSSFLEQLVNKVLDKLPVSLKDNQDKKIDTYADLYAKYCDNIDNICNKIIEDQTNLKNTMNTSYELLKILDVLLELLENVIITGENDKNEYLKKLNELGKDSINERKAKTIRHNVVTFEKKLSTLRESLATNNALYDNLEVKNMPNIEILMQYDNFVKTISPNLKFQSYDTIGTKQQSDRLNSLQQLSKAVNSSMIKNSETLNENLANAQQIGSSGFIEVNTLTTLRDNTFKALSQLENYQAIMAEKRRANDEIVNGILNDFKKFGSTPENLLTSTDFDIDCTDDFGEKNLLEVASFSNEEENGKTLKKKLGTMDDD